MNKNKYFVKINNCIKYICYQDITYISCDGYLCSIYNENNVIHATQAKLLKEFEIDFKSYGFIRANRNTLININHLKIIDLKDRKITLTNNIEITISFRKLTVFRKLFKN